jgi:hypothetical protein
MAQKPAYCVNCGQSINPGASFCSVCGTKVVGIPDTIAIETAQQTTTAQQRQRRRPSIFLIVVGLLLILVGLRSPAALVFGQSISGEITSVEQLIDNSSDRIDYNYQINYMFTIDGKSQSGNYNMNRVYNSALLPSTGSSLPIKYIPGLPFINTPTNQGNPGIAMLLMSGLGILLIILGAKGRIQIRTNRGNALSSGK